MAGAASQAAVDRQTKVGGAVGVVFAQAADQVTADGDARGAGVGAVVVVDVGIANGVGGEGLECLWAVLVRAPPLNWLWPPTVMS
ncbi:hypothetical protein C5H22_00875 [Xylella fastidiosa]|nr:hypothetical protein C5H22_00875 [Xylella fastidiosa]